MHLKIMGPLSVSTSLEKAAKEAVTVSKQTHQIFRDDLQKSQHPSK